MVGVLEKLAAAGIEVLALESATTHYFVARDGFAAAVELAGKPGAPGLLTEKGYAALVWRGEDAWFVAKGFEQRASAGQIAALRRFGADLKAVFGC